MYINIFANLVIFILVLKIFILGIYSMYISLKIDRILKNNFKKKLMDISEFTPRGWLNAHDYYHDFEVDKSNPNFNEIDKIVGRIIKKMRTLNTIITIDTIFIILIIFFLFFKN